MDCDKTECVFYSENSSNKCSANTVPDLISVDCWRMRVELSAHARKYTRIISTIPPEYAKWMLGSMLVMCINAKESEIFSERLRMDACRTVSFWATLSKSMLSILDNVLNEKVPQSLKNLLIMLSKEE